MKDFPAFTTENGVASLVLREIPYSQSAYIKILNTLSPEALLDECRQFCIVVGAERIYASGNCILEKYPLHTCIYEMRCNWTAIPTTRAKAMPIVEQNLSRWKDVYNQRMMNVPNASYMDDSTAKQMLKDGSGYFVEVDGEIIGIGKGSGECIEVVATAVPGYGMDVVLALCNRLGRNCFSLQVADTNTRAINLYERLGFSKTKEISRWYKIL